MPAYAVKQREDFETDLADTLEKQYGFSVGKAYRAVRAAWDVGGPHREQRPGTP
ncbi:hypothetical protein [uncultured Actinomyces sp.]|jgi:hypothetical protein|uniref:hypothetical protein n=1 Tax=uncultured Actinomyces sp. TaxID=249061 RepID=UPI002605B590|nr:hypothetical protein [uncultured Actinomyces sp.]